MPLNPENRGDVVNIGLHQISRAVIHCTLSILEVWRNALKVNYNLTSHDTTIYDLIKRNTNGVSLQNSNQTVIDPQIHTSLKPLSVSESSLPSNLLYHF